MARLTISISLFTSVLVVGTASAYAAPDLIGKWSGTMKMDGSAFRNELARRSKTLSGEAKKENDQKLKMIDQSIVAVGKTQVKLDLKKDGVGFIQFLRPNTPPQSEWCKWVAKGKSVTLSAFSGTGDETLVFTGKIIDNGKTLTFDASQIFTRQMEARKLKNSRPPKLTITFVRQK